MVSRRTFLAASAGATGLALTGLGDRAAAAAPPGPPVPANGCYFGAYAFAGRAGISEPAALEARLGHPLRISHSFQTGLTPPAAHLRSEFTAGRIPMLSWRLGSQDQLVEIVQGNRDSEIEDEVQALAALPGDLFLRPSWEFDLRYDDAALFVAAWQYLHAAFAPATQVALVWCPTWRAFRETDKADALYPGNAYVDWVGADGYGRPKPDQPAYHYRPFDLMFDTAHAFAVAHSKPFMVGEFGVHRDPADPRQAAWLDQTRAVIKTDYPALKAAVYFHLDGDGPDNQWRVTEPPGGAAEQALAAWADDPYFDPT